MNHLMLPLLSGADYKSLLLPNGCRMSCLWCLSPPLYCFTLLSPPVLFVWSVTSFTSFCSLCLIAMASLLVWAIWQTGHGADNTLPCVCIFKCISYRENKNDTPYVWNSCLSNTIDDQFFKSDLCNVFDWLKLHSVSCLISTPPFIILVLCYY